MTENGMRMEWNLSRFGIRDFELWLATSKNALLPEYLAYLLTKNLMQRLAERVKI